MSDTRTQNMARRRVRILEEARKVLAEGGFDALNLRDLADVSGITVPTIYNLIGNKAEVLKALVMNAFEDFEASLEQKLPCPTMQLPSVMMTIFTAMIGHDEAYYRAAALASERLENEPSEPSDYGFKRGPLAEYAGKMCTDACQEGLLKGEIAHELLVEQMIGNHQIAFRDWAHRVISLQQLREQSLRGFYIALAADATEAFREKLVADLKQLAPGK